MALVRASVRVGRRTKRLRLVGKRILAETPTQRRNRIVTNKPFPPPNTQKHDTVTILVSGVTAVGNIPNGYFRVDVSDHTLRRITNTMLLRASS